MSGRVESGGSGESFGGGGITQNILNPDNICEKFNELNFKLKANKNFLLANVRRKMTQGGRFLCNTTGCTKPRLCQ